MFICRKKFCYAALTAKTFANFASFLDPKMEVEKWSQKWCQNLTPKMGSKNGTQKGGPIFFWFKKDLQEIKALFKILGLPFGCHFWTPFWGVKFWHHFWVHFSTSILGSKNGAKFAKVLLSKLHSKTISSKQTCISKCICSHSQLLASFNTIQFHLVKPSRITTNFLPHVLHISEPQNLILWRSLHATPVFYMKKWPPFWGSSKLTFLSDCFIQRITPALQLVYAFLVRARSFFKFFYAIFFSI